MLCNTKCVAKIEGFEFVTNLHDRLATIKRSVTPEHVSDVNAEAVAVGIEAVAEKHAAQAVLASYVLFTEQSQKSSVLKYGNHATSLTANKFIKMIGNA